jgi:outer membrane protein, multidrug efflux system
MSHGFLDTERAHRMPRLVSIAPASAILATPRALVLTTSLVGGVLTLAGCTVGPNYTPPKMEMPSDFASASPEGGALSTANTQADDAALAQWWTSFNDPILASLVERAVKTNLDVRLAEARIREARALRGVAESDLVPSVDATGGASRSRGSENDGQPASFAEERASFRAGIEAGWEIDVFGRVRRSVQAARADVQATEEDRRAVLVSLVAEVARTYLDLRTFQQRQLVSDRNIETQSESVELTQSRLTAGIAAELEVAQSAAQLAFRRSQRPPLSAGERAAVHRLGVLLGQWPGSLREELAAKGEIPRVSEQVIGVGLPSDLLRRRPDVRQAERRIAAATARIGVATADLFPRFSLTGAFGLASEELDPFLDLSSRTWSIGPSLRWNIFDAGRIRRTIDAAGEREKQALLVYERTVLGSLEDVENSLTNLASEQLRTRALEDAVVANRRAVQLADERYRAGLGDFLNVLESQRQLYDTEDQLVVSQSSVSRSLIGLYLALGGGWSWEVSSPNTEASSVVPTPQPNPRVAGDE